MRPVVRGDHPEIDGKRVVFKNYDEALPHLAKRLGSFCSYCERKLAVSLAVEHVLAKNREPSLEFVWGNFLLACTNCNSIKGRHRITLDDYLWPERDNTFRAFRYLADGRVKAASCVSQDVSHKAERTVQLVGLDRRPGHPRYSRKDRRWRQRMEAWEVAHLSVSRLARCESPEMRATILALAKETGFWSLWMIAFSDDVDMVTKLIHGFAGTAQDCFNESGDVVERPGGRC